MAAELSRESRRILDEAAHATEITLNTLDDAWGRINSLGGRHDGSSFEVGYAKALTDALSIIEDLGGKDPLVRKHENSQFGVGA